MVNRNVILKGAVLGLLSERFWRDSVYFPKDILEIIAAVKAAGYGNFGNGIVSSEQRLTCLLNADIVYIFLKGNAGNLFEFFG